MNKNSNPEYPLIFAKLKEILQKYESASLYPQNNKPNIYELVGPPVERSRGENVCFGAVHIGLTYVLYHLMPLYDFPDLIKGISPELKKHLHARAIFNFKSMPDDQIFNELAKLTEKSCKRFKKERLIL